MDFTDARVMEYLHRSQPSNHPVLLEMEARAQREGFPAIGPLVGRTCALLARATGARRVFELGSGFGYSTFWFARAVGAKGRVVHTEDSPQLASDARDYLRRAGLGGRVDFRLGDAVASLQSDRGAWDLVFIDIEKEDYPAAWKVARERVRPGGLVVTDNTLWHGKVADPEATDAQTKGVRAYNEAALADPGFLTTILPLRDGVTVSLRLP